MVDVGGETYLYSGVVSDYYFTKDGGTAFQTWCDYAVVGCGNISGSIVVRFVDIELMIALTAGSFAIVHSPARAHSLSANGVGAA